MRKFFLSILTSLCLLIITIPISHVHAIATNTIDKDILAQNIRLTTKTHAITKIKTVQQKPELISGQAINSDGSTVCYVDGDTFYIAPNIPNDPIYAPEDSSKLFFCLALREIDLSHLDTSKTTNMSYMFQLCSNLTTLNLGDHFNTIPSLTVFKEKNGYNAHEYCVSTVFFFSVKSVNFMLIRLQRLKLKIFAAAYNASHTFWS